MKLPRALDERFADWVDGRLTALEKARLEAELAADAELREAAERYRATVALVRHGLAAERAPIDLTDAIMAHLDEPQAPPEAGGGGPSSAAGEARTRARRYRLLPVIASIAAAAAIVLVFLMLKAVPGVRERFLARNPAPDARAVDTPAAEDRSATPADLVTVDAAPGSDRGQAEVPTASKPSGAYAEASPEGESRGGERQVHFLRPVAEGAADDEQREGARISGIAPARSVESKDAGGANDRFSRAPGRVGAPAPGAAPESRQDGQIAPPPGYGVPPETPGTVVRGAAKETTAPPATQRSGEPMGPGTPPPREPSAIAQPQEEGVAETLEDAGERRRQEQPNQAGKEQASRIVTASPDRGVGLRREPRPGDTAGVTGLLDVGELTAVVALPRARHAELLRELIGEPLIGEPLIGEHLPRSEPRTDGASKKVADQTERERAKSPERTAPSPTESLLVFENLAFSVKIDEVHVRVEALAADRDRPLQDLDAKGAERAPPSAGEDGGGGNSAAAWSAVTGGRMQPPGAVVPEPGDRWFRVSGDQEQLAMFMRFVEAQRAVPGALVTWQRAPVGQVVPPRGRAADPAGDAGSAGAAKQEAARAAPAQRLTLLLVLRQRR